MLGLVAMVTIVDSLYASMKALVCIVGNNQLAFLAHGENGKTPGESHDRMMVGSHDRMT